MEEERYFVQIKARRPLLMHAPTGIDEERGRGQQPTPERSWAFGFPAFEAKPPPILSLLTELAPKQKTL